MDTEEFLCDMQRTWFPWSCQDIQPNSVRDNTLCSKLDYYLHSLDLLANMIWISNIAVSMNGWPPQCALLFVKMLQASANRTLMGFRLPRSNR